MEGDSGGTVELKIGAWRWRREEDGSVIVSLGSEYSRRLRPKEWAAIVEAMSPEFPQLDRGQ